MKGYSSGPEASIVIHDPRIKKFTFLDVIRWWRKARKSGALPRVLRYAEDFYFSEAEPETCQPFNLINTFTDDHRVKPGLSYHLHWLRLQISVTFHSYYGMVNPAMDRDYKFALYMCHDWDYLQQGTLSHLAIWPASVTPRAGVTCFEYTDRDGGDQMGDFISRFTPLWTARGYLPNVPAYTNKDWYQPPQVDVVTGNYTSQPAPVNVQYDYPASPVNFEMTVPLDCFHTVRDDTVLHRDGSWTNFPVLFWSVNSHATEVLSPNNCPTVHVKAELIYTRAWE